MLGFSISFVNAILLSFIYYSIFVLSIRNASYTKRWKSAIKINLYRAFPTLFQASFFFHNIK